MKFRLVSEDEINQVRNLDGAADAIRRKAKDLVVNLGNEFNNADPGGFRGVQFSCVESPRVIGTVQTKIGAGRLRLTWKHDGNELFGEVVVDREIFDEHDRQCWEPVYSFLLAEQGRWRPSNQGGNSPHYLNGDSNLRNWALGASIFYAILNGPVTA
jgi:hypothetical protein